MKKLILKKIKNVRQFFITLLIVALGVGVNDKLLSASLFDVNTSTPKNSKIRYLEMTGYVKESKNWGVWPLRNIENAQITILNKEHKVIGTTFSNKSGKCVIKLPLDNQYTLNVSKKGWVTKTINIDTRLKGKKLKKYILNYDIEMFEDISGLDVSVLNKPIAYVTYNNYLKSFDYDFLATDKINSKIKTNYLAYYKVHPENNITPRSKKSNNTKRIKYTPGDIDKMNTNTNKKNLTTDKKYVGPNERNERINYKATIDSFYNTQSNALKQKKSNEIKISEIPVKMDSSGIVFKIEILSMDEYIAVNAQFFKKFGSVNEYIYNGKHKYTIGEFKSFEAASKMLGEINKNGYKDALLVAFFRNQRITMDEALLIKHISK